MVQPINYLAQIPQPDLGKSLLSGLQLGAGIREMQQQQLAQEQALQAKQQFAQDLQSAQSEGTQAAWLKMIGKYPQFREAFDTVRKGVGEERVKNEFFEGFEISTALKNGRPDVATQRLETIIEAKKKSGEPVGLYEQALSTIESGNVKAAESGINQILATLDPDRFEKTVNATSAFETERRTAELFPALKKQKEVELRKATSEAEVAEIEAKYADRLQQAQLAKTKRDVEAQSGQRVQSSSIRPDGTVVIVTSAGQTRVIGPDGVELTGQARVDAVRGSEEFGADIQALRSGARKAGEIGQTEAQKAFENVGKIRKNISNLESAIAALDAGANTGVIASKFPNWKASTIELQNIQRQLGLDIIGSVTFGALSEGELSLALETALPLNMNEAELKDWLIRKKTAQTKLADYITDQARFLSVPGRTLGDWLLRAEQRGGPQTGGMTAPGTGAVSAAPASEVSPPPQSSPTTSKSTIAPLIPPINMSESDRELWEAGYYTEDDKRVLIDFYATQPGAQ